MWFVPFWAAHRLRGPVNGDAEKMNKPVPIMPTR
jgi:hypothetical protein